MGLVLAGIAAADAQPCPSKPVRVICTFAAGGTSDVLARGLAIRALDQRRSRAVEQDHPARRG
jgi:tripartite-type tricarboxylate transporter receptor subunit TctC